MDIEQPARDSDEDLLARYVGGGESAFAQLVERYTPELFRFLVRFVGQRALAEDIVQETFIQVHISAATFDRGRRVKPWLFTIAANKARDALRSRVRRREVSTSAWSSDDDSGVDLGHILPQEEQGPEQLASDAERSQQVRGVLQGLPDHLREVLVLGYFHRLPYRDMAETLGVPIGTVKSRLHAAVAQFGKAYRRMMGMPEDDAAIAARAGGSNQHE